MIRYNVIKSRQDENTLPAVDLTITGCIKLLKKLEIIYGSAGYVFPGDVSSSNRELRSRSDLCVYLARHGLPDNCPFENITPSERLALEHFIATFESDELDILVS
jgi:hypothetical protein